VLAIISGNAGIVPGLIENFGITGNFGIISERQHEGAYVAVAAWPVLR
jgi:hypothetical protein